MVQVNLDHYFARLQKKLNIKTVVISDDENGPAQNYSDEFIFSQYNNKEKIKEFVSKVDIITYEFENIPINILNEIDKEKKSYLDLK